MSDYRTGERRRIIKRGARDLSCHMEGPRRECNETDVACHFYGCVTYSDGLRLRGGKRVVASDHDGKRRLSERSSDNRVSLSIRDRERPADRPALLDRAEECCPLWGYGD